jgi:hypothetical protein
MKIVEDYEADWQLRRRALSLSKGDEKSNFFNHCSNHRKYINIVSGKIETLKEGRFYESGEVITFEDIDTTLINFCGDTLW